jgi:signal transduction histidine kinase
MKGPLVVRYRFEELVDLVRLKALMTSFHDLTGLPSTVIGLDGAILTTEDGSWVGVGWKRICLDFHRIHPGTAARCHKSDTELAADSRRGGLSYYCCLNGLVDAVFPIIVDGEHLANLFTGQFFLQPPDREAFRRQAQAFGFDEEAYLASLDDVPVFSRDFVDRGMRFLEMLAVQIGEMGKRAKEQRDLNAAMERASQSRSRFFAAASHDLRQPLQALRLFLDMLGRGLEGTSHSTLASRAGQALGSAEAMVNALFDIARIEAGVVPPKVGPVDLAELFDGLMHEFGPLAAAREVGLRQRRAVTEVHSDPMMLGRVLRNLLANAVRHAAPGSILLAARRRRDMVVLEVWDTGPGIAPEHLELIWEEFYQVEDAGQPRSSAKEGLGLGLSIARKLTQELGHRIEVCSRVGHGTRFRVMINH